jgi:hypothetical protein
MAKPDEDYLWDRSGEDADAARFEKLLSPLAHDAPLDELRLGRKRSRLPLMIGIATPIAAALVLVLVWPRGGGASGHCVGVGMVFESEGTVACNGEALSIGVLPINGQLDTGKSSAEITIADIGTATLSPNTIVRLDHTSIGKRHQLFLQEGKMHAKVLAPPKIFAVATPSAQVTDLGCEYTLEIDRDGAGVIRVITGKVELETGNGAVVMAPAGTHGRLLPGRRASLPLSDRAGPKITAAVAELEAGKPDAIAKVLAAAGKEDAITIANLARVAAATDKRRVLERLAQLVAAPQCTTIDEALEHPDLFEMWFEEAYLVHLGAADGAPQTCPPPP